MKTKLLRIAALAVTLWGAAFSASAVPYIVGGASQSLIGGGSGNWSWDGSYMAGIRAALENPANFGPAGVVNREIQTATLATVDAGTLSGVNMFVGTWISDSDAALMSAAVLNFFLNGGDLFLLQDDSSHDGLGTALGISTTGSTGSVSNGGAPLFNGPFGIATDVVQLYAVGQLSASEIAAHNGHVGGTNADGQITSAFWAANEYAPGAGALFIIADIDMIATTPGGGCGSPTICGASYSPLNDNGIYALNTFSFLQEQGGSALPEPGSIALLGLGLLGLGFSARRKA